MFLNGDLDAPCISFALEENALAEEDEWFEALQRFLASERKAASAL